MATIAEIINTGKVSAHLASLDVLNSALFGRRLDPRLPLMLQIETDAIEWHYLSDPTDISLIATTNYLIELCGNYAAKAELLINGGSGGTIINPTAPVGYEYFSDVFIVTPTDENNGNPYDASTVWYNPLFIDAKDLTYLIIDNTVETLGNGFTFDSIAGTITRSTFFTGSVISVSFLKKI